MPNINNVNYINNATAQTHFIVSDNRLVRRIRYTNLLNQILGQLPSNRTDQDLFTTSTVRFQSIDLVDTAGTSAQAELAHALNFDYVHADQGQIRFQDIIGSIRFGGNDGISNIAREKGLGAVNFFGYALEDFQHNGSTTTNAGAGWSIVQQPVGLQLSLDSRRRVVNSRSVVNQNPANPPLTILQFGSIEGSSTPVVTTSSNGLHTYNGVGRTLITFVNSTVDQYGIPLESQGTADNPTLVGTNVYTFNSSRTSTFIGRKDALLNNDTIGAIEFRGYDTQNSVAGQGALAASIYVHTIENFDTSHHGSSIHLRTVSSGTNHVPTNRIDLQDQRNIYTSENHLLVDNAGRTIATLSTSNIFLHTFNINGQSLHFPDGTQQTTAWNLDATVPTSSASTGTAGQVAYDNDYIYVCVANNTWKRIQAQSF